MKKRYCILLFGLVIQIFGWLWVEHYVLPYVAIRPYRVPVPTPPLCDAFLDCNEFDVVTKDSVVLKAVFLDAKDPIGTIVLVHGIGACKEFFATFATRLSNDHFNVVLFDLRAQGKSGGDFCTFGSKETDDIGRIVDAIKGKEPDLPVAIYGSSLGGALALQAMANDDRIACGVIESTYNRLETVMNKYWTDMSHFHCPNLVRRTMQRSAAIAGFDPAKVNPVEACALISSPVFFAHGSNDEKIPMEFNRDNFEATQSQIKEFVVVEGAGHINLHQAGGEGYYSRLLHFLKTNLR